MAEFRIVRYISREANKYTDANGLDVYSLAAAVKFRFNVTSEVVWKAVAEWGKHPHQNRK